MIFDQSSKNQSTNKLFGQKIYKFHTIDSTNTCGKILLECGADEGTIVYADYQTEGRGRYLKKWISEPGENLLFSILFKPEIESKKLFLIPFMVSISIVESVRKLSPACGPIIKWPNDILTTSGKKIAGILTETAHYNANKVGVIVGIGLNVNQTVFPPEIESKVSSICLEKGEVIERVSLFQSILDEIERIYPLLPHKDTDIIKLWKSNCPFIGKPISITQEGKQYNGIFKDIDSDGALLLEEENSDITRILTGEVI